MIGEIILTVMLLCCLVIFGVDFAFYLKSRYCRFHIGRWEYTKWQSAVEKKAHNWLNHTPTVKITDNSRYILLDFLQGKYRSKTIQSWQKAALILGLLESDNSKTRSAARDAALDLLDKHGYWKNPPVAVDCGMLSYAILKATDDPQAVKPAMDFTRSIIEENINEAGMISYTGGKHNPVMYVDTLGLTCAFLALYAKVYGISSCAETAFRQLQLYHEYGLLEGTALPNHAFHIGSKFPLGVYGWGRGVAWYVIGLVDSFYELESEEYRNKILQWIAEAADSYAIFQHPDGGFGSILQRNNSYDSSATAVMAWFYAHCDILFKNTSYKQISANCLAKLLKKTRITGAIDQCQGDTKDIGIFAQTYDIMPFAQGMALRAINLSKNRE
jgi:unsaturated rhamnogalacturonyl hydrolase